MRKHFIKHLKVHRFKQYSILVFGEVKKKEEEDNLGDT